MGIKKTLGGDRLGAGKKMTVSLHKFGRSNHNLSKVIRTDQAPGTLVPYYCNIGLNGDTFYIDLETKVRTLPTNGPIFGSFKHQIDVFFAPIRLYIAALHNNALGVGLKMEQIKLPIMTLRLNEILNENKEPNSQQISQSSLLAYIGIRGLGTPSGSGVTRAFPAMFMLMYWDIYKNYYANKQEEIGYVIGTPKLQWTEVTIDTNSTPEKKYTYTPTQSLERPQISIANGGTITIKTKQPYSDFLLVQGAAVPGSTIKWVDTLLDPRWIWSQENGAWVGTFNEFGVEPKVWNIPESTKSTPIFLFKPNPKGSPSLTSFNLSKIDDTRERILQAPKTAPFDLRAAANLVEPYSSAIGNATIGEDNLPGIAAWYDQAGLGIKTYLSDRFNNWLSTEWIDGVGGINEITSVDVSDGKLSMDALILARKVYNMMNRIAISGGSYNDWQEAVYGMKTVRLCESPMYMGGMASEIVFDEVVSTSESDGSGGLQPLGSLAGRGADRHNRGGRSIKVKVEEIGMLMIIGSITPRIDYSQGNKWWNRLQTMNDFHKPNLDGIGFQELITEEFAAFDTQVEDAASQKPVTYFSAGKQPAWIEYMTDVNETYGSFSAYNELAFMALNRNYEWDGASGRASDITTYIDPTKYNIAFADSRLDAKNFWVQVGMKIEARRVMSARQIPNA